MAERRVDFIDMVVAEMRHTNRVHRVNGQTLPRFVRRPDMEVDAARSANPDEQADYQEEQTEHPRTI